MAPAARAPMVQLWGCLGRWGEGQRSAQTADAVSHIFAIVAVPQRPASRLGEMGDGTAGLDAMVSVGNVEKVRVVVRP